MTIILALVLIGPSFVMLFISKQIMVFIHATSWTALAIAFVCFIRYLHLWHQAKRKNLQPYIISEIVFPAFRFETERTKMEQVDYIPLYILVFIIITECWSMLLIFTDINKDYIGLGITCLGLTIGVLYITNVFISISFIIPRALLNRNGLLKQRNFMN